MLGQLVAARFAVLLVLRRIDPARFRENLGGDLVVGARLALARGGRELRPVDRDNTDIDEPRPDAQTEDLAEQLAKRRLVPDAEPRDRRVIRLPARLGAQLCHIAYYGMSRGPPARRQTSGTAPRHTCAAMPGVWQLRAAVLTLVGVLVVHHGRYLFAPPEHEHQLSAVHSYLVWLTPLSGVLVFLVLLQLALFAARAGGEDHGPPGFRVLWPALTTAMLSAFGAQEGLELFLIHGHLPGLADLLASGGWTAVPFAVAAAGVAALLLRGAARVVRWAAARRRRTRPRRTPTVIRFPRLPLLGAPRSVLARRLAGRGPPVLS